MVEDRTKSKIEGHEKRWGEVSDGDGGQKRAINLHPRNVLHSECACCLNHTAGLEKKKDCCILEHHFSQALQKNSLVKLSSVGTGEEELELVVLRTGAWLKFLFSLLN